MNFVTTVYILEHVINILHSMEGQIIIQMTGSNMDLNPIQEEETYNNDREGRYKESQTVQSHPMAPQA